MNTPHIVVVGDVMIDVTVECSVERISPEAPVPVYRELSRSHSLGGAGNVAANIAALAPDAKVSLVSFTGIRQSTKVKTLCREAGVEPAFYNLFFYQHPEKVRYFSKGHYLARVDDEVYGSTGCSSRDFTDHILNINPTHIVIADYCKGALNGWRVFDLIQGAKSRGIPVYVDTKPDHFGVYKGVALVKLNRREANEVAGYSVDGDDHVAIDLALENDIDSMVITLDSDGLVYANQKEEGRVPAYATNVVDVTGAGDTTLAALSVSLARGSSLKEACEYASRAAGLAVERRGTSVISDRDMVGDGKEEPVVNTNQ